MAQVSLRFHSLNIRREGFMTDDGDYLEADVDFDLAVGHTVRRGLASMVKQSAGATLAEPLEILPPAQYQGPMNYGGFRDCVEQYARQQLASYLASRRFPNTDVSLRNIRLPSEWACSFFAAVDPDMASRGRRAQ